MANHQTITVDAWLKELESSSHVASAEGISSVELIELTGRSREWMQRAIRLAIRAGSLAFAGRRKGTTVDGRVTWTPVYRLTNPEKLRRPAKVVV